MFQADAILDKPPAGSLSAGLRSVLELARWAPSGDNTQPWRFQPLDERRLVVHGFDTRDHCVYDLDGHPSQISLGALLETMRIAATAQGWRMETRRQADAPDTRPTFEVVFIADPSIRPDPLVDSITRRSVQRRPLKTRPLTATERQALESALPQGWRVQWLDGFEQKRRTTSLLFRYAKLRLTMPEAYTVHRDIIEWNARFSEDRVPDGALGIDAMTVRLMRFVMGRWERVAFFNRFLAGTWAPRIQMELIPGMACAAHFVLLAPQPPQTIDDYVAAGRAVQRFWLTVTHLGLQMQPELTPLIFTRYVRERRSFTTVSGIQDQAERLARDLVDLVGEAESRQAVFMGRVGAGKPAASRSTRRPVDALLVGAA
jgi:hypothetical protein